MWKFKFTSQCGHKGFLTVNDTTSNEDIRAAIEAKESSPCAECLNKEQRKLHYARLERDSDLMSRLVKK